MDYGVGLGVDMGEQILFCLCECNNGQVKSLQIFVAEKCSSVEGGSGVVFVHLKSLQIFVVWYCITVLGKCESEGTFYHL